MPKYCQVSAVQTFGRRNRPPAALLPVLLLAFVLALPAAAQFGGADNARVTATVMVMADLSPESNAVNPSEIIYLHLHDNTDIARLLGLAQELGKRFNAQPLFMCAVPESEIDRTTFVHDKGLFLQFQMDVLHPGDATLPIAPFIEAFAPEATRLRILYRVSGPYTFAGIPNFDNGDVNFSLTPRIVQGAPFAIYDMDAVIVNPRLDGVAGMDKPARPRRHAPSPLFVALLFGLALVIGISGGVLLTMLLNKWKAEEQSSGPRATSRETKR